jgi:hypothetical protein
MRLVSIEEQTSLVHTVLSPYRVVDKHTVHVTPTGVGCDGAGALVKPPPTDKLCFSHARKSHAKHYN